MTCVSGQVLGATGIAMMTGATEIPRIDSETTDSTIIVIDFVITTAMMTIGSGVTIDFVAVMTGTEMAAGHATRKNDLVMTTVDRIQIDDQILTIVKIVKGVQNLSCLEISLMKRRPDAKVLPYSLLNFSLVQVNLIRP